MVCVLINYKVYNLEMSLWWILLYMKQSCFQYIDLNGIVNDAMRWLSILIYI